MSRIRASLDSMNKHTVWKAWPFWLFTAGFAGLLLVILLTTGVFDKTLRLSELQLVPVEQREIAPFYNATGEALLHDQRILIARTAGTVESIRVTPGSQVTKGTVLATLNSPEIKEELEQLEADLSALQLELKLHTRRLELAVESQRYAVELAEGKADMEKSRLGSETTLHELNVVSDIDFNLAQLRFRQAEIELKREQQELRLAEQELEMDRQSAQGELMRMERQLALKKRKVEDLSVAAPVDLTVLDIDDRLSLGASFDAGTPLLNYYETGDLAVRVRVPPDLLPRLGAGQKAEITAGNSILSAYILRLGARIEGGSLPVWLKPDEPLEEYVTEGQDIPVRLTLNKTNVPFTVLKPEWYRGPGRYPLYCLKAQRLAPCDIEFGYADEKYVEVLTNLDPGTKLEMTEPRRWLGENEREVQP